MTTTHQFDISAEGALHMLQRLDTNEYSDDDRGEMVRINDQRSIPVSEARVDANHTVGTRGVMTYSEYKKQLAEIVAESLEVTDLPSQDDPKARLMAIMVKIGGGELVLNKDLGLTVSTRDVFSTVTGHLVHRAKIEKDRTQRMRVGQRMYVHLPLNLHMEWLRGKIVEQLNTRLQALPDNLARATWILANNLVGDNDGLFHSFKFCDGFVRQLSDVPTMVNNGLITQDATRTSMFQFLVTNLISDLPKLPSRDEPEQRLLAMLDMEVGDKINIDGILVPPERLGFTTIPGDLELAVMRPGQGQQISWNDHCLALLNAQMDETSSKLSIVGPAAKKQEHERIPSRWQLLNMDPDDPTLSRPIRMAVIGAHKRARAENGGAHGNAGNVGQYRHKKAGRIADDKKYRAARQSIKGQKGAHAG